jgi:hypothetical protein
VLLHADDRQLLEQLAAEGALFGQRYRMTYFFYFGANLGAAIEARQELLDLGCTDVVIADEATGSEHFHIAAFGTEKLARKTVAARRRQMEAIASRHEGRFDGWDLTRPGGTRLPEPIN